MNEQTATEWRDCADPDEIRYHLRGKDLACWCHPDQPCHADVLLDLANGATA